MKIVSWNVHGLGCRLKRAAVKDILHSYISDVGLIQETKLSLVSENTVKEIFWGATAIVVVYGTSLILFGINGVALGALEGIGMW